MILAQMYTITTIDREIAALHHKLDELYQQRATIVSTDEPVEPETETEVLEELIDLDSLDMSL